MIVRAALTVVLVLGLLAAPSSAEAQQAARIPRVVYLSVNPWTANLYLLDAFREQLRQLGHAEGETVLIELRHADGKPGQLPRVTAELVRSKPDVILASNPRVVLAAIHATTTIPIVFTAIINPLGAGIVANLARPAGNVTGVSWDPTPDLAGKQLELLRETVPRASRLALLWNPDTPGSIAFVERARAAAQALGVALQSLEVRTPAEFQGAFGAMANERAGGALVLGSAFAYVHRDQIARLAAQHRLPAIYGNRDSVDGGGLMSYGPSLVDQHRRAAYYVDKILKGAKPGDLPVEQPTKFELVINLKTAKALGLTIPPPLLLRADQVME